MIHFQSGNTVGKFLRRSLDGVLSFNLPCRVITAKFQDKHRLFVSEDSAVHYLAILNTDNPDMFVLLDVDENNESAVSILNIVRKYF